MTTSRKGLAILLSPLLVLIAWPGQTVRAEEEASAPRWQEQAYGVSLLPPTGTTLYERVVRDPVPWTLSGTGNPKMIDLRPLRGSVRLGPIRDELRNDRSASKLLKQLSRANVLPAAQMGRFIQAIRDDAILRIVRDDTYMISFYIDEASKPMEIEQMVQARESVLTTRYPSLTKIHETEMQLADRPGALQYFIIKGNDGQQRILGQAAMKLDPQVYVSLRLDADQANEAAGKAAFEAVLRSLAVEPTAEINRKRTLLLSRGELWHKQFDLRYLQMANQKDPWEKQVDADTGLITYKRWFRVVDAQGDTGYILMGHRTITKAGREGVEVQVLARVYEGDLAYDSQSKFFASYDGAGEEWTLRTTVRPRDAADQAGPRDEASWWDTGIRDRNTITVVREGPSGLERSSWPMPREGYLSQVELHLMAMLLPKSEQKHMAFYAYHPASGKLTLRTIRIEPNDLQGVDVYARPTPLRSETIAQYDAVGDLVAYLLPGDRLLVPATDAKMSRILRLMERRFENQSR